MKILTIILEGRIGGPQHRITEVGRELRDSFGIETVAVFPSSDSEGFQRMLKKQGIKYHAVPLHKLSKGFFKLLKWFVCFLPQVLRLRRIVKMENPDIVHCHGSWQWKGVLGGWLAGKQVVWHLNDTYMPLPIKLVFRVLALLADGIIVQGQKVKDYYLGNIHRNCLVEEIASPVNTRTFDPAKIEPAGKLSEFDGCKVVTVGNVNHFKGIEYLIEAAAILSEKHDDIHIFEVGNLFKSQAGYIKKLKHMIHSRGIKNFHFVGYSDKIGSFLKAADIYVCSSIFEASPLSVWEAMSMGKAIVSTEVGSVPDFITDGENGFLVPIKDGQALAEKIAWLAKDPGLRETFGKKARVVAQEQLDVKISARKHKEIYEKILRQKDS